MNPMAVDLARLSIWIHTFVPGLPLSLLDYNLVRGNSLVGIATLQEASDLLVSDNAPLFSFKAKELLGDASVHLAKIGRLADADASEIKRAREAYEDAQAALDGQAALFDILAASRLHDGIRQLISEGAPLDWFKDLSQVPDTDAYQEAKAILEAIEPFHFPIAFPQVFLREKSGFDVILGNPPWEEATIEEDRFWTRHVPGLHSMTQGEQERTKAEKREARPDLVEQYEQELAGTELMRKVLVTGPFPGMGTGDPDLYKGFVWRFWSLGNRPYGRTGVVLPRSVFSAKGAAEFREEIFKSGTVEDMTNLVNNRQWVFDEVHPQYTVTLFCLRKAEPTPTTTLPMRGPYRSMERYLKGMQQEPIQFELKDVLSWTETAALPLLPDEEAADVFAQIRKAPNLVLDADSDGWRARPYTELHATNDKKYMEMVETPEDGWWPVYGGRSFDIWEPDTGSYYAWAIPDKVLERLKGKRDWARRYSNSVFYEFDDEYLDDEGTHAVFHPRIAFRDMTRATDTRTARVALIPPNVAITNKGPYMIWVRGDQKDEAYLLGVMSSIPFDWYSRRFVETAMNFHILEGLPVPRPERTDTLWQRVVELAGRLAAVDDRYAEWADAVGVECGPLDPDEKDVMIFELDAVVAHLYGLSEDQLTHIFETFHEGWDYKPRLNAVLTHYRRWST